jgi:hypothetical protein
LYVIKVVDVNAHAFEEAGTQLAFASEFSKFGQVVVVPTDFLYGSPLFR